METFTIIYIIIIYLQIPPKTICSIVIIVRQMTVILIIYVSTVLSMLFKFIERVKVVERKVYVIENTNDFCEYCNEEFDGMKELRIHERGKHTFECQGAFKYCLSRCQLRFFKKIRAFHLPPVIFGTRFKIAAQKFDFPLCKK